MTKKQKLELTWIGKENRPKLEPRILLEDPEKSYHAKHRVANDDFFDNLLIQRGQPARPQGAGAGVRRERNFFRIHFFFCRVGPYLSRPIFYSGGMRAKEIWAKSRSQSSF
jgi:hypothetical protein